MQKINPETGGDFVAIKCRARLENFGTTLVMRGKKSGNYLSHTLIIEQT
jgi:hypothetical protein